MKALKNSRDEELMHEALDEAFQAFILREVPIGAVIVKDDHIIGRGHNLRELTQDGTNHAEMLAIQEACAKLHSWRLEDCTMYVTVEPCLMCAGAILNTRIKRVVYGTDNPKAGVVNSLYHMLNDDRFNHQVKVERGLFRNRASQLLKSFFKRARRIKKQAKRNKHNDWTNDVK